MQMNAAVHEFGSGTSRHFAVTQKIGRFRSDVDIQRTALRTDEYAA